MALGLNDFDGGKSITGPPEGMDPPMALGMNLPASKSLSE